MMNFVLLYLPGAIGTGLVGMGVMGILHTRRFVKRCLHCDGRVIRYDPDVDGDPSFPVLAFVDRTGRTYEITRPSSPRYELGTIVPITYYPPDPANAWTAGSRTPFAIPSVLALAGLGLIFTSVILVRGT
ncbi:MAG: DUF3592 domain-containing protein [Acidobacteriota bacterium]